MSKKYAEELNKDINRMASAHKVQKIVFISQLSHSPPA